MDIAPNTVVVWSDIGCPWAHAAVSRLHRLRHDLPALEAVQAARSRA